MQTVKAKDFTPDLPEFYFQCKEVTYSANTLHEAALLWKEDGGKLLLNVGRVG